MLIKLTHVRKTERAQDNPRKRKEEMNRRKVSQLKQKE